MLILIICSLGLGATIFVAFEQVQSCIPFVFGFIWALLSIQIAIIVDQEIARRRSLLHLKQIEDYFTKYSKMIAKTNQQGPFYNLTDNSITCKICNKTSHNENDIKYKYCGSCNKFLDDTARSK
jgi:hypothetical protein